ncbi:MAG TPA: transposase, partial [Candidatus Acidoferrales bacterium]|nr:transposase [Candidatus Acidoferrales bacterium]
MPLDSTDSLERMTPAEVIGLARELIGEVTRLRAEYEKVSGALAKLRVEHQAVKDELARLKNLPPRPPQKPSGMDKATDQPDSQAKDKGGRSTKRRGCNLDKLTITQTIEVKVDAPAGSRHKGYDEIVVQDLVLNPLVTRYRRERWETPDGKTVVAPLDPGIVGGYGPHLHRVVLTLHYQCHVTIEKILALLNGMGVVISKRQVGRLLNAKLETFRAEDAEVLRAGLSSAPFVTVDDTGARHRGKPGFTTHIGSDRFAVFRTGPSKSRLAFLGNLLGGAASYVVNEAALVYMRACNLSLALIDKLAGHPTRLFASHQEWTRHLDALGFADLRITPDPVRVASEGALWGAVREQGLLGKAIVVSDGAGQFRVGEHALCWVHAERLVHKLVPANEKQRNAIEVARRMIWWFYAALKEYKLTPSPEKAERLRAQFDRIFDRCRTGYATLDSLLRRLFRLKDDLLRVLDHPHIPLHTNASENDIRVFVTKRKISGGTVSDRGRDARDVMLGLAKTCRKLKIPFFGYLGARLGIPGPDIPDLATLVSTAP